MATVQFDANEEIRSPRQRRRRRKLLIGSVLFIVAGIIASLLLIQTDRYVPVKGYVISSEHSQLRSLVTARIAEIRCSSGTQVNTGDVLIVLEAEKAQAELELAQAELAKAVTGAASWHIAKLKVRIAEAELAKFTIAASHGGMVQLMPLHVGDVVQPDQLLGEVFGGERQLKLRVTEREAGKLKLGQPVRVSLTLHDRRRNLSGKVLEYGQVIRADDRAGYREVICSFLAQDVLVGATCRGRILVGRSSVMAKIFGW